MSIFVNFLLALVNLLRDHLRSSIVILCKFKACVLYFLSNFYFFIKWQAFKNYEKCFLFDLKSSFGSRDIQIFVFFFLFHIFQIQKGKFAEF